MRTYKHKRLRELIEKDESNELQRVLESLFVVGYIAITVSITILLGSLIQ